MNRLSAYITIMFCMLIPSVHAQILANFSANSTSGCAPLAIQFQDLSTGNPVKWNWDFGNGNKSTLQNPSAVYIQPGIYTVSLTVENSTGQLNTKTSTAYIEVFKNPEAGILVNKNQACLNSPFLFSSNSKPGNGPISQYLWDFGDGNGSKQENPSHAYTFEGYKKVTLIIKDTNQCESVISLDSFVYVFPKAPISISSDKNVSCSSPARVAYSFNGPNDILSIMWYFGDGDSSNTRNPIHFYTSPGSYTAKIKITDKNNCIDSFTKQNSFTYGFVDADFSLLNSPICKKQEVKINNTSKHNLPSEPEWLWKFDDGSTNNTKDAYKEFTQEGLYTVKLIAKLPGTDCIDSISIPLDIRFLQTPDIKPIFSDSLLCSFPSQINFKPSDSVVQAYWRFTSRIQDTSRAISPNFIYSTEGNHTLHYRFLAPNDCWIQDSLVNTIIIEDPSLRIAGDTSGCVPIAIDYETIFNSKFPIQSIAWYLDNQLVSNSNKYSANFTSTISGNIKVQVVNSRNCKYEDEINFNFGEKTNPDFDYLDTFICINSYVKFVNLTDSTNKKIQSFWKYTKTGLPVEIWDTIYQYQTLGKQTVSLITINNSCADTITKELIIEVKGPLAGVIYTQDPCTGIAKIANNSEEETRIKWRIDNIDVPSQDTFVFNMLNANNAKNVVLIAFNDTNGCPPDTFIQNINPVYSLDADFTHSDIQACAPQTITFTNRSTSRILEPSDRYFWLVNKNSIPTKALDSMQNYYSSTALNYSNGEPYTTKPQITITKPGTYTFSLVSNRKGCIDTLTKTLQIGNIIPIAYEIQKLTNCVPLKVRFTDKTINPNSKIKRNIRFGNGDYIEDVPANFEYTYTNGSEKGFFNAVVFFVDSTGCETWIQEKIPISGPKIDFSYTSTVSACENPVFNFQSQIISNPNGGGVYSWDLGDSTKKQGPNISHQYQDSNHFVVQLSFRDNLGCEASVSKIIVHENKKTLAKIAADTTSSPCPPLVVNFTNKSQLRPGIPLQELQWEFGDGTFSTLNNPSKTYTKPGNYTVKLHIKDSAGCVHSEIVSDLVVVKGPTGTYTFSPAVGCEPLEVSFAMQTNDPKNSVYWDLGDGETNTQKEFKKTYAFAGVFTPYLIVTDTNGCKNALQANGVIRVNPNPKADFVASDFCFHSPTFFRDSTFTYGIPIVQQNWSIEGQSKTGQNTEHLFSESGLHKVQLAVKSAANCVDTIEKWVKVYGFNPQIISDNSKVCLGQNIVFRNQSTSDTSLLLNQSKWLYLGEEIGMGSQIDFIPKETGKISLSLYLQNILGCDTIQTIQTDVVVGDTFAPAPLSLLHVSVIDDQSLQIKHRATQQEDFEFYHLYSRDLNNNLLWLSQNSNPKDTFQFAKNLNTLQNVYCFKVVQQNFCGYMADPEVGDWHCSVEVSGQSDTNASILQWNAYKGWQEVDKYIVFKRNTQDPSTFDSIGQVPGNTLSYIDSVDCFTDNFAYRILAVEKNGNLEKAWSDTCWVKPVYLPIVNAPYVLTSSVPDNLSVSTQFVEIQASRKPIAYYNIERSADMKQYKLVDTIWKQNGVQEYYDQSKLDVQNQSYAYRVKAVDICNDQSPVSNLGKTIVLRTSMNNNLKPVLYWTPYTMWEEKVAYYIIEKEIEEGIFIKIGQTPTGLDTTFTDENQEINCAFTYRYRVTAVRNSATSNSAYAYSDVISISNISKAPIESKLFSPTAFSPNNDGINDVLELKGVFIKSFHLEVFNRWGEKLYESYDCFPTWDGTYKGHLVPEGVYVYKVNAVGADDKLHVIAKDVTLIR